MPKLKKRVSFETTFGVYVVDELLGEGGAGRVYGGVGPDETPIALKVLAEERATADKRRRFKNEISFLVHRLFRNVHEDRKYANVSKRLEPDRVNHSSVSVH